MPTPTAFTPRPSEAQKDTLEAEAQAAIKRANSIDPGFAAFLDKAYAYVVFPSVGKGGAIVGGAFGRGIVYERGQMIGYAKVEQANIGLQLGGQTYTEIVAFENKAALDRFRSGALKFAANASAVAVKSGAATEAKYQDGIVTFTNPNGGLMFEASVGGQQFGYQPANQ